MGTGTKLCISISTKREGRFEISIYSRSSSGHRFTRTMGASIHYVLLELNSVVFSFPISLAQLIKLDISQHKDDRGLVPTI